MSDGPHRSLPLRKAWKVLAKRGDQEAYDQNQVSEAAKLALVSDFRNEVAWSLINALKNVFIGRDNSLGLREIALQQLGETKSLARGSVFGMNAIAWSVQLVQEGRLDLRAFYDAVGLAAKERGFANSRSVEEHYLRESNVRRADHVSKRLTNAISGMSEGALGMALVEPKPTATPSRRKRDQLDEGVPLR